MRLVLHRLVEATCYLLAWGDAMDEVMPAFECV